MSEFEKTARGFNVYGRVPTHAGGSVRVQDDSSLAFEGPHVWLFLDGEQCTEHLGRHQKPDPQLSVEQAKQLRDAELDRLTRMASELLARREPVPEQAKAEELK